MGVPFVGVAAARRSARLARGEADRGKVPGISSSSCRDASFAGTVRGVRVVGGSWDRETLFGVEELRSRRRAELRRAMAATNDDLGCCVECPSGQERGSDNVCRG